MTIYDYDMMTSDEFLGQVVLDLHSLAASSKASNAASSTDDMSTPKMSGRREARERDSEVDTRNETPELSDMQRVGGGLEHISVVAARHRLALSLRP